MSSTSVDPSLSSSQENLHSRLLRSNHLAPPNGKGKHLSPNGHGPNIDTETPSGTATPVPTDAPPSVQATSSARKALRAQNRKRLFPTIDYTERVSHFDRQSEHRDFSGFFVLFWIGLAIMVITTMLRNVKETGFPFRLTQRDLFLENIWELAASETVMVGSMLACLPLHKLYASEKSWLRWGRAGIWVQSALQALWLFYWVQWPFLRTWTWTAQVFFTLHLLALFMKMHSWSFYNGHLAETLHRLSELDDLSNSRIDSPSTDRPSSPSSPIRPPIDRYPSSTGKFHSLSPSDPKFQDMRLPREELDQLREDLAVELTSPLGNVTYPQNLTFSNFVDFLCCPTLCYELQYPRISQFRWDELCYKILAVFGCIFLLTVTSEEFIIPVLSESAKTLNERSSPAVGGLRLSEGALIIAETISRLLFPFMVTFLLVFLVIFEYVCGAFAEITRFADRHFYDAWWNSSDWLTFSRAWNVPVHHFFRRHVFLALTAAPNITTSDPVPHTRRAASATGVPTPRLSKPVATVITFFISAIAHELVMGCITKKLRGYSAVMMMLQMPIVVVQRSKFMKGRPLLNNILFWCSMIFGLSMMCTFYVLI